MLNPNIWRSQQLEFHWQDLQISYHDQGEGPVLLLLHGLPGSSWDWHLIWPMLSGRFRLIAPDLPGCGDSAKPLLYDYRLADQAAVIRDLLQHLQISDYQLIAHDYGAAVSWALLNDLTDPPRPSAISWLAPRITGNRNAFLWRERWLSGPSGEALRCLLSEGLYGRYLERLSGPDSILPAQVVHDSWQLLCAHQGLQVLPKMLNYRYELPLASEWSTDGPPLPRLQIIRGEYDPLAFSLPPLAGAEIQWLKTGHFPHLEDPARLIALLHEFHAGTGLRHARFENLRYPPGQD